MYSASGIIVYLAGKQGRSTKRMITHDILV